MTIFDGLEVNGMKNDHRMFLSKNVYSKPSGKKFERGRMPVPEVNDSWSLDRRDSSDTSVSWPDEMEAATTAKVMDQWQAVQRTLYDEDKQVTSGSGMAECVQWRSQKPRLRVVGKGLAMRNTGTGSGNIVSLSNSKTSPIVEEIIEQHSLSPKNVADSVESESREQRRREVFDLIVDFICAKVAQKKDEDVKILGENFDDVLKITPALRNYSHSSKFTPIEPISHADQRPDRNDFTSASSMLKKSMITCQIQLTDDISATSTTRSNRLSHGNISPLKIRSCSRNCGRNTPGTIFSEKIIVSPVPFSKSTKESFCTLKSTPIGLGRLGSALNSSPIHRSAKSVNIGYRGILERRAGLVRMPHVQSAWQAPVCPTVWPKNVRLAPIDLPKLSANRNRPLAKSVTQPRRSRNSLSPIPREIIPASAIPVRKKSLEIEGRRITNRKNPTSPLLYPLRDPKAIGTVENDPDIHDDR